MNDMSLRPVPAPEMTSVEALHPKERRSRRFAWIGMAASIILFSASLVVLWHVVSGIDLNELKTAFTAASFRQIGLAILLTAVSYSLLTCYDAIAFVRSRSIFLIAQRLWRRSRAMRSVSPWASLCSRQARSATGFTLREG